MFDEQNTLKSYWLKQFGNLLSHRARSWAVGWALGLIQPLVDVMRSPVLWASLRQSLCVSFAPRLALLIQTRQCSEEGKDVPLVSIFLNLGRGQAPLTCYGPELGPMSYSQAHP